MSNNFHLHENGHIVLNCYVQQVHVQMPVSISDPVQVCMVWVEDVTTWSYLVVFDYK